MRAFSLGWIALVLVSAVGIAAEKASPPGEPLPAWETEDELAMRERYGFPEPEVVTAPPSGTIQSYPEWAPADGVLISWMGFDAFLADMVREFVQLGTCWIAVESSSQQTSVTNYLLGQGIPVTNVDFLVFNMDTVWMIDFGPFFINVDGNREITDHIYDRYGRWQDDQFPIRLGNEWDIPVYSSELRIEGGNFIADGMGICFSTNRLFEQNSGYLTEQEVRDQLRDYCGCETLYTLTKLNDGTGHIDMFAKLLDEETMLVGQYTSGSEVATLNNNAALVESLTASTGNQYSVIRIPMPGSPSDYWTYTNSLFVGDHILVPIYGISSDTQALQIYQDALPGYSVVGIDASDVIGSGGAIHCTTKVVPMAASHSIGITSVDILDESGDADGILDPGETATIRVTARNTGSEPLNGLSGLLSSDQPGHVTVLDGSATWPDLDAGESAVSDAPSFQVFVSGTAPEGLDAVFTIMFTADGFEAGKSFTETITRRAEQYEWNMDVNPGWTLEPSWAWGDPTGSGGDPQNGFTGTNVLGYNLSGTYTNSMTVKHATSTSIDCSDLEGVNVSFRRWLGVESSQYDHAVFSVSNNGSTFQTIWSNPASDLVDTSWVEVNYDISAVADGQAAVYLRWTMGSSDSLVVYSGWNIDDVVITGVSTLPTPTPAATMTPSPTSTPVPTWTPAGSPTPEPSHTAEPSPTPGGNPYIRLRLNDTQFEAGELFDLECDVGNGHAVTTADRYIILDVYANYWFYPGWTQAVEFTTETMQPGYQDTLTILEFVWPEVEGHADTLRFWAAHVDPSQGALIGDYSMVSFAY